jgi:predicted ATPase
VPATLDRPIGRDTDVAALIGLVDAHRLVTVVGPGGIGKTRLAQEVARSLGDRGREAIRWVDLAAVPSPDRLAHAIASAAGVQLGEGDGGVLLGRALLGRRMLLMLDNCEHLAPGLAQLVGTVLDVAPDLRIVATSQAGLRLEGEHLYALEALSVPRPGAGLAEARTFGAVQLLEQRARARSRNHSLTEASVPSAISLCRHLDGNALAIEMAASWVPVIGVEAVLSRLSERFALLRSAVAQAPARQKTLRAALEWSHSLLGEEERKMLRRLSVFSGSFALEAVQAVAAQGRGEWDTLDTLAALVDKSFVQVEGGDRPRYRLLESTHLYASERLAEGDEGPAVHRRHATAMAARADEMVRDYWMTSEEAWLERYLPDYADLAAAFDRAVDRADAGAAAPIGVALNRIDDELSVLSAVRRRKRAAHSLLPCADPAIAAKLWNCLSSVRLITIDEMPLIEIEEKRAAAWRALGDRFELFEALGRLAIELAHCGRREEAREAMAEARAIDDSAWPLRYRANLAYFARGTCYYLGELEASRAESERFLALVREAGSRRDEGYALSLVAEVAVAAGRLDEAIAQGHAACSVLRDSDQPGILGLALTTLCSALLLKGEWEAARVIAREALPVLSRTDMVFLLVDQVALLAVRCGLPARAAQLLFHADAHYPFAWEQRRLFVAAIVDSARSAVDAALGDDERRSAERAGAALSAEQFERVMRESLELDGGEPR